MDEQTGSHDQQLPPLKVQPSKVTQIGQIRPYLAQTTTSEVLLSIAAEAKWRKQRFEYYAL